MNDRCVDSDKCIYIIRQVLDQEASAEEEAFFMSHVAECQPCLKEYQVEQRIRFLLKSNLDHKSIPKGLADEIRAKIQGNLRDDR